MGHLTAAWRRLSPFAKDAVAAVVTAVLLVWGSYGEGHPRNPADTVQFHHHPIPHPTAAALLLVAAACLALAWRRRRPTVVLAVSATAVTGYSLLGYVNGAALVAPLLAIYAMASQVGARRALAYGVATLTVLLAATSARNPFPQPAHRQDPRQPHHDQAERPRPRPARGHRLRNRAGDTRRALRRDGMPRPFPGRPGAPPATLGEWTRRFPGWPRWPGQRRRPGRSAAPPR